MTTQRQAAANAATKQGKPAIVENPATIENVPSIGVSQTYAEVMSSVFKSVTIAIRTGLDSHAYDGLKYGDDNGVNATISNCLTSLGFNTDAGHGAALLSVLTRSVSQLLPNVDYSAEAWTKGVFDVWAKGALLKGQLPKAITATSTAKGKIVLPFSEDLLIGGLASVREIPFSEYERLVSLPVTDLVKPNLAGDKVFINWLRAHRDCLTQGGVKISFIGLYTKAIENPDSPMSKVVTMLAEKARLEREKAAKLEVQAIDGLEF